MSASTLDLPRRGRVGAGAPVLLLIAGFAAAVAVRVADAGPARAASTGAGLLFAAVLLVLTAAAGTARGSARVDRRSIGWGLAGGGLLVLGVVLGRGHDLGAIGAARGLTGYPAWATATVVVAGAEEAFLRGALFDALRRHGSAAAVLGAAAAFAALHVPLYGWRVVPLDLAVGVLLGALRVASGTWTAPAVAHVTADLAGWWLL